MSAQVLLGVLKNVRQTAPDRWLACCPAHDDKSPSLSVREIADGRVLVHCFAGCDASNVVESVGLAMPDLMPPTAHRLKGVAPNHYHATREALRALHWESLVVAIAAENLAAGVVLDDADRKRLGDAATRIRATAEAVE